MTCSLVNSNKAISLTEQAISRLMSWLVVLVSISSFTTLLGVLSRKLTLLMESVNSFIFISKCLFSKYSSSRNSYINKKFVGNKLGRIHAGPKLLHSRKKTDLTSRRAEHTLYRARAGRIKANNQRYVRYRQISDTSTRAQEVVNGHF